MSEDYGGDFDEFDVDVSRADARTSHAGSEAINPSLSRDEGEGEGVARAPAVGSQKRSEQAEADVDRSVRLSVSLSAPWRGVALRHTAHGTRHT